VLLEIRDRWPDYRKRARMLIVMDVSGSMDNRAPLSTKTKLELARSAALEAIDQLDPNDEVGLWAYSPASSTDAYLELVPTAPLSTNGEALRSAIGGLSSDPGNRGELCSTAVAAVTSLRTAFDPTKINGVVLLSDGPDDGSPAGDCDRMLGDVAPPHPDEDVRVFTIAYGDAADTGTLTDLARASLGTAYDASDPTQIGRVFSQVVANF
jgi:Ca-activated chloride channel family protein